MQIETIREQLQWIEGSFARLVAKGLQQASTFFREKTSRRLLQTRGTERCFYRSVASMQRQLELHLESEWEGAQLAQAQQEPERLRSFDTSVCFTYKQ